MTAAAATAAGAAGSAAAAAGSAQTTTGPALASALRISVMRLARRLRAERADSAGGTLSLNQLATLVTLERHGPLTPGELAAHERVQPPSMTRIVADLEASGLIERRAHPSDRRQALVVIGPAGRELLREDRRRRDAWLACRLQELSAEQLEALRAALPVLDHLASA